MAAARSSPGGVALCTSSFVDEVILLLYNGSMACRVYFNTESITVEIPIKFYHFAPEGKQSIATSPSVCMSVCPHAYLKIHKTELHQIFRACSLRCSWLGSPLTTLCISGFVYEVILSRNRQVIHAFSSNWREHFAKKILFLFVMQFSKLLEPASRPLLAFFLYGLGVLQLNSNEIRQISVAWNDVFSSLSALGINKTTDNLLCSRDGC